jgi:hypothetical protein
LITLEEGGEDPDKVRGGHCLVNWKVCTKPKKWGGLCIKDLEKFDRSLRLRWLWLCWDEYDRPWKRLLRYQDRTDSALFFASTLITVGDGTITPFWEAKWVDGASPMELAPNLYSQARYKFRIVHHELQNFNWTKNLRNVNTKELLDEFVLLFSYISQVSQNENKDAIVWK